MSSRANQNSNRRASKTSTPQPIPLDVLDLSTRAYNSLRRAGFRSIADIALLTDEQLLNIRNLGTKTLAEIRRKLAAYLDDHPVPDQIWASESQREGRTPLSERTRIGILRLSLDTYNALWQVGVLTLGQLVQMSSREILDIQGIDEKELAEIDRKLQPYENQILPEQAMPPESEVFLSEVDTSSSDNRVLVPADTSIAMLGLSARPHNALTRDGINTIGQLTQMSSRQIRGVYNIGAKSLTEIEEKLEAYLTEHSLHVATPVESELSSPLIDSSLLKRADCAPLDDISVERLGLPDAWQDQLLEAGVMSIGELICQTSDALDEPALLEERLKRYLTWLVKQDEATWADEVGEWGISPLHRMELSETSLDDLIEGWLSSLESTDDRDRYVIYWRYGLYDERLTLEEVGNRLGVSRERARQLEKRALNHLSMPQHYAVICPLTALLEYLLVQAGSLMNEEQVNAALQQELVVNNVDPIGVAHLVFEINNDAKWLRGTGAWGLKSAPVDEVLGVQERLAHVLEKELVPLPIEEVIDRFKSTHFYRNRQETLEDGFIFACLRVHPEVSIDGDGQCGLEQWERHRINEIILALREIGEPVHYTVIAEKTSALLEPEMRTSAHNIHAHMQRLPDIFVRVGHGVYGLAEWGLHDDGSLANAAHRVLSGAGKPLHQDIIADQVLETWKARRSSVHMALKTDYRFVQIGSGVYWLREKIAMDSDTREADFGDLFGERLEQWQESLNVGEDGLGYDTHAEADAIRQIGTDFFK